MNEQEKCGITFKSTTRHEQSDARLLRAKRRFKRLLKLADYERQLIAYEIHDGLAQQLAGAIMEFEAFDHDRASCPEDAGRAYTAAMRLLRQGLCEARRLIAASRPPMLDESGVVGAIASLVRGCGPGPKIKFRSDARFVRLAPVLENTLYRIAQEALTNACRHSQSKRIAISLRQSGKGRVRLVVRDWGIGLDPKVVPKGRFGLEGIQQRARLLGGKCSIQSKPGQGTCVTVEFPVVQADHHRTVPSGRVR